MPPIPVEYVRQPYVRGASLGQLLQLQGRNRAEAELRRGEIGAQMWGQLGQQITGAIAGERQAREQAPRLAQEAEARALTLENAKAERDARVQLTRQQAGFATFIENEWDGTPEMLLKGAIRSYGDKEGPLVATRIFEAQQLPAKAEAARADREWQEKQRARTELDNRRKDEERGVRDMLATAISSGAPMDDARRAQLQGMALQAGGSMADAIPKPEPRPTYDDGDALVNGVRTKVLFDKASGNYYLPGQTTTPLPAGAVKPIPPQAPQGPQPGWQWVTRNGEEIYTNRVQPGDRPQNARVKATEDERKAAGFYGQMSDAIAIIDELEGNLTEKELYQIQTLPQEGLIGLANRGELSEAAKRYLRAFEQFTESRLRPVSGAAINDAEYARDRRTYARQYAETPKLAADRKSARNRALDSLRSRAGVVLDDGNQDRQPQQTTQVPDLAGLRDGMSRKFREGPFAGQEWTVVNGQPKQVR